MGDESTKEKINIELSILLKQPLIDLGRTGNLLWLSFGEKIVIKDRHGYEKIKGKYALNIQCSWRITTEKDIILASRDFYLPRKGLNIENFEWDELGANRFDEKVEEFKKRFYLDLIVTQVVVDEFGGLKIYFDLGIRLEIFPDDSLGDEYWRFIEFGEKSKHFVVFDKS